MADPAPAVVSPASPPAASAAAQEERVSVVRWSLALRIGFRFCVAYFTLFILSNQIISGLLPVPGVNVPELGTIWPLRHITFWTAKHLFRVDHDLVYTLSGSGDKTFDWVLAFCLLLISALIVLAWSLLDRNRPNYVTFYKWFRVALRFALASEMFLYGLIKAVPLQMPFPSLNRLVQPYGNFSPMGVLWSSIGASRSYEIFTGCAETLGGVLLLAPRTAVLGALVCLADMIQVFTLNMTYDVPVKLLSFHLVVFSLFLLAPEARRLFTFFLTDRPVPPSTQPPLFHSRRASRIALGVQLAFGLYLIGINIFSSVQAWYARGGGRVKPSIYGIWNVEQMTIDGQLHPPLSTDQARWRRVVFDYPTFSSFQRQDDSIASYGSSINDAEKTVTLTKTADKSWKAVFSFTRSAPDQLALDGSMDGHKIQMQMKLMDRDKFTLVNRGFHWINEYPFQR